jgi:hypothetical protein
LLSSVIWVEKLRGLYTTAPKKLFKDDDTFLLGISCTQVEQLL